MTVLFVSEELKRAERISFSVRKHSYTTKLKIQNIDENIYLEFRYKQLPSKHTLQRSNDFFPKTCQIFELKARDVPDMPGEKKWLHCTYRPRNLLEPKTLYQTQCREPDSEEVFNSFEVDIKFRVE